MNAKRIFSLSLYIIGEALLIVCFLVFGQNIQNDILTLNIIVSSLIYSLFFIDILITWVDFKDKSQKQIGSIGIRWFITFLYILLAIGEMVFFNSIKPIDFIYQLIIQLIILFILVFGLYLAFSSAEKVKEVFLEEKQHRDLIDEMKKTTKELQMKLNTMENIPEEIISRLNKMQQNLRFLSPGNNKDAYDLEWKYLNEIKILTDCFLFIPINYEKINYNLKSCEITINERKMIFSN